MRKTMLFLITHRNFATFKNYENVLIFYCNNSHGKTMQLTNYKIKLHCGIKAGLCILT